MPNFIQNKENIQKQILSAEILKCIGKSQLVDSWKLKASFEIMEFIKNKNRGEEKLPNL